MERSLLFESSVMFDNSTLIDRIRQSLIDISIDPPSEDEVQDLLKEALSYLDKDIPIETATDLFSLISACFSHYPQQLSPIFSTFFKDATKSAYHIIVTAQTLADITHPSQAGQDQSQKEVSKPVLPDNYIKFVNDALDQILPQISILDCDYQNLNLKIFDHEIPPICEVNLILNLLLSANLTEEIVEKFSKIVMTTELLRTNPSINFLISDILKRGFVNILPAKVFTENSFISSLTADEIALLIPELPTDVFADILKNFEDVCLRRKNAGLTISFLKKCQTENQTVSNVKKLIDILSAADINDNGLWDFLKKFEFKLSDRIASELTEFDDPVFALKIMPKPNMIPEAILSRALLETSNIYVYDRVFAAENVVNPVLATTEFWIHLISILPNEEITLKGHVSTGMAHSFQENIGDKLVEVMEKLIYYSNPPKHSVIRFLTRLVSKFPENYATLFTAEANIKNLLSKLEKVPPQSFWALINSPTVILDMINEKPTPILILGYCASKSLVNRQRPMPAKVTILPQTDESNSEIIAYMSVNRKNLDRNRDIYKFFEVNESISMNALSLISAAILFAISEMGRGEEVNNSFKIEGLTKVNLLAFVVIMCDYIDQACLLKAMCSLFKTAEMLELRDKALVNTCNNNAPMVTVSLNKLMWHLSNVVLKPDGIKFAVGFLDVMIPFLLRNEYSKENARELIKILHQITFGSLNDLHRFQNIQIFGNTELMNELKRQTANKPIPENTRALFNKYGKELLNYFILNSEPILTGKNVTTDDIENIENIELRIEMEMNEPSVTGFPINLSIFDATNLKTVITTMIQTPSALKLIKFLQKMCIGAPKFTIQSTKYIIEALQQTIAEQKWDDCAHICSFMKLASLDAELAKFIDQPIQHDIKISILHSCIQLDQIKEDFLISTLLSSPHPEDDRKLGDILFNKLMDENTKMNHLIFLLEKINDRFSLTASMMFNLYFHEFLKYGEVFIKALHTVYVMPPDTTTFLIRPNFAPIARPLSPFGLSIVNRLLDESIDNPSIQSFTWLKFIANSFPFFFVDDPQKVFDAVLPSLDYFVDLLNFLMDTKKKREPSVHYHPPFTSKELNVQKVMINYAALEFLFFTLYSPIVLDAYVDWVFENICDFTDSQVFANILIIQSLYNTKSVQHVMTAVMMKGMWPEIISSIIEREIIKSPFKDQLYANIFTITSMYYRSLNSFTQEIAVTIDELQQIDNPFEVTYDHCISLLPNSARKHPLDILKLPFKLPKSIDDFAAKIVVDMCSRRAARQPQGQLDKFLKEFKALAPISKPYDGPLPDGLDRNVFLQLPLKFQSTVLHHSLPKIPKVNAAMRRYLVTKSMWIGQWISKSSSLLMLPDHYAEMHTVLADMNNMETQEEELQPEDSTLMQFCQASLFEDLINQAELASKDEFVASLHTVFRELSQNGTALMSLLEYIAQHFSTATRTGLRNLMRVLSVMSKSQDFKANFPDICAPAVLDVVCAPENRVHKTLLGRASSLFSQLGDEMPNRVVHLIGFMFISGKQRLIPAALDLCAKLNDQKRENVMIYVQNAFDNAIQSYRSTQNTPEITEFLKRFPIVATARQRQLLSLLQQLLKDFHKQSLDLIGALFNVLAPHRNRSQSIRLSDSVTIDPHQPRHQSLTIPPSIVQQAPEFWKVFEENRKTINHQIQLEPHRLRTTFKFLLEYPELTDFSIRVAFFHESMREKINHKTMNLNVRRQKILEDSFRRLHNCKANDILANIHVKFIGESGYDAGGLRKDWFTSLVKEMFNPNYALFIPSANKRSNQPNPSSYVNTEHIHYFRFAGLIIARALIDGVNLDAHLTTSFCKHILQTPVSLRDVEDVDESLHQSLQWMLDNDVELLDMQFTADIDDLGKYNTIDLKPNGSNIKVVNENKDEFVALMVDHRLKGSILTQVRAFCEGFNSLIPLEDIRRFSPNELDLLICGIPEIDVVDLQKYTEFQRPYNAEHQVIKFFFAAISKWDNENLAKLLLFITGSSQVPLNGFRTFKDMNQPITIAPGGSKERLPAAHTCFNTLDLPEYDNEIELNQKLMFAIQECNSFGFI